MTDIAPKIKLMTFIPVYPQKKSETINNTSLATKRASGCSSMKVFMVIKGDQ